MVNEKDSEDSASDTETACDGQRLESVKLTSGLSLCDVESEAGATFETRPFEIEPDFGLYENEKGSEEAFKYSKKELAEVGSDEDEEGKVCSPFEKIARHMKDISPDKDKSVLKQLIQPGIGVEVKPKSRVTIHYNAYFEYQTEPYDSTYLRRKKLTFRLGESETLSGLDMSVASMSLKEKSHFIVKPQWGYGEHGCPPRIPKNATIFFEVVLVNTMDDSATEEFEKLSIEEQKAAAFNQVLKFAKEEQVTGNGCMIEKNYSKASSCYYRAVRLLENATFSNESEESQAKKLLLKLYQNQCLVFDRRGQFRRIMRPAHEALLINPKSTKALFRLGRAHGHFCEWGRARSLLHQAQRLEPNDSAIKEELINLDKRQAEFKAAEKVFCHKMFSQCGKAAEIEPDSSSCESDSVSKE